MPTCKLCKNHFPNRIIINGKQKVLNRRKFCLDCSPFNLHNTNPLNPTKTKNLKTCPKCKQTLDIKKFYFRKTPTPTPRPTPTPTPMSYCINCVKTQVSQRQKEFKKQCVNYKGGKCEICDYNRNIAALEFHHLNPDEKDFEISRQFKQGFNQVVIDELNKCKLVCANCHREVHYPNN